MLDFVALCCPQCKGPLEERTDAYLCAACAKTYPIILGIPDFRLFPDPYISIEDDHRKGQFLWHESHTLTFEETVRLYWHITPHVERARAERFIRSVLALTEKGQARLREIERLSGARGNLGKETMVEIGCGTGGFLVAAAPKFRQVVGVDIAFRWLAVARKRLVEESIDAALICACAEYLPLRAESADLIVAEDALAHVRDQAATLAEAERVARNGAAFFLATPNRFSLAPDPHVRVWGLGFVPRRWMGRYVKWVKGTAYEYIRVPSYFELKRLLRHAGWHDVQMLVPTIPTEERRHLSAAEQRQVAVYEAVRKVFLFRALLYLFGPFLHVFGYARKAGSKQT